MQTGFYTNKENLIKFLKWIKENIKDAVIIDSKLKGDDVIDLIEKDILTCCGVLVFDKDCEIFKTNEKDIKILNIMEWKHSISINFYLCDASAYSFDFTDYVQYSPKEKKSIVLQEYMLMDITLKKKQEKEIKSITKWLVSLKETQKNINIITGMNMF